MKVATRIESGGRGEDRIAVEQVGGRTLIAIADGAGGTGRGAAAAEMICGMAVATFRRGAMSTDSWVGELLTIDGNVLRTGHGGQATVVVVEIEGTEIRGASVGDSGCWAIDPLGFVDLTAAQNRKPLLGTGAAMPTGVGPATAPARFLMATDGLLKYCPRAEIARISAKGAVQEAVDALIAKVRLRSGGFQDDVAIVLCDCEGAG
ncbi:MAG: SpoIIE family protein phosphatase [Myxococcales bacterium]